MNDRRALLEAILECPEDDLVRLVFADWLQENGEEAFAEYICVAIEWFRLPADGDPDVQKRLVARFERAEKAKPWRVDHLPKWIRSSIRQRGWIDKAACSANVWVRDGECIVASEPIHTLSLERDGDGVSIEPAFHLTCNRRIRRLELLAQELGDAGLIELSKSRSFERLEELYLYNNRVMEPGLRALAGSEAFAGLRVLSMPYNEVWAGGVRALGESPWLTGLRELDLSYNEIGPEGAKALAESANFRHLEVLLLAGNWGYEPVLEDEGVAHLCASPHLGRLQELDLSRNRLTDAGAIAIADSKAFGSLRRLDLQSNAIGLPGFAALLNSPNLPSLERLDLSRNPLHQDWRKEGMFAQPADGLRSLRTLALRDASLLGPHVVDLMRSAAVSGLSSLDLNQNGINSAGVRAICRVPGLRASLKTLELEGNPVRDFGAKAIAETPWASLRTLNLGNCRLGPEAARHLAASDGWGSLRTLTLSNNPLTDEGVASVAGSAKFPLLRELELYVCECGDAGAEALLKSKWAKQLHSLWIAGNAIGEDLRRKLRTRFKKVVSV